MLRLAWLLVSAAPPAHGVATVSTPRATVTLLSEQPQATPGQTLPPAYPGWAADIPKATQYVRVALRERATGQSIMEVGIRRQR